MIVRRPPARLPEPRLREEASARAQGVIQKLSSGRLSELAASRHTDAEIVPSRCLLFGCRHGDQPYPAVDFVSR